MDTYIATDTYIARRYFVGTQSEPFKANITQPEEFIPACKAAAAGFSAEILNTRLNHVVGFVDPINGFRWRSQYT